MWSSRINASKPQHDGICVGKHWSFAFYFYDLRKHYAARMTIDLGLNVLQTDTDAVWLASPYPALKAVYGQQQIVAMADRPLLNAGVFYAQNVARGDGAAWVLEELARRIHLFLLKPEAVKWCVARNSRRNSRRAIRPTRALRCAFTGTCRGRSRRSTPTPTNRR